MRRLLSILVVFGAGVAAVFLAGAGDDGSKNPTYKIQFDNAFGLVAGGDLKIGGVRAGKTKGFEIEEEDKGSGRYVRGRGGRGHRARLRQPQEGRELHRPAAVADRRVLRGLPARQVARRRCPATRCRSTQTSSVVNQDLINNILRRPYSERFRLILSELGTGLAGRPDDIQEVLKRAHPGLRETSQVLEILGRQNEIIKNFITDSDTVVKELEAKKHEVARWVDSAGETAEISASSRDQLEQQFQQVPGLPGRAASDDGASSRASPTSRRR